MKQYYRVGQVSSLVIAGFQIALLGGLRDQIISAFTNDPDITAAISAAWPILLIFMLFDAT